MNETPELRASRRWCTRVCRQSRSSFWASFALLDRPRRQAMCALYAFARMTDDLGDSPEPVEIRSSRLNLWREQLWQQCGSETNSGQPYQATHPAHGNVSHPLAAPHFLTPTRLPAADSHVVESFFASDKSIWPALADCVHRYRIPVQLLDDIIGGVAWDLEHRQPADWNELRNYCYHVASTVGLACVSIWQAEDAEDDVDRDGGGQSQLPGPRSTQAAIDCGFAFQLTNILRDIAEDAQLGRIYFPQSLLADYGVDPQCWLAGQPNGDWEAMLDSVAERARKLYVAGWPTIETLTPRSQRMFSLIWRSYRGLLEQIVNHKSKLWNKPKIRLPNRQRLQLVTSHFVAPFYSRLPHPCITAPAKVLNPRS